MSVELKSALFDEPAAADARAAPKRFKFAATFVIDLAISLVFVAAVVPVWAGEMDRGLVIAPTFLLGVLILLCYVGKVLVIAHLDKAGGDARTYVKSSALVTDGPYAYSRNPTYLLAMIQFLLWAALAFYLQAFAPWRPDARGGGSPARAVLPRQRSDRHADGGSDAEASPSRKRSTPTPSGFAAGSGAGPPRLTRANVSRRSGWRRPWRCARPRRESARRSLARPACRRGRSVRNRGSRG